MGTDAEGERIKDHMRNITPILLDQTVPPQDKLRIIALYVISKNGITDENLNRLVHHAQISVDDKQTIVNIANLGINVVVDVSRRVFVNCTLYGILNDTVGNSTRCFICRCRFASTGQPQEGVYGTA